MLHAYAKSLGDGLAARWRERRFDDEAFPALAAATLAELPPPAEVAFEAVALDALFDPDHMQHDRELYRFSDAALRLYTGPGFVFELLVWVDGTTSIHEHAFAGAFRVLQGSSIHARFDFETRERVNASFLIGDAALRSVELLTCGEVRAITPGHAGLRHGLFHLDRPSLTLVVRTDDLPGHAPQYTLRRPHFAIARDLTADTRIAIAARTYRALCGAAPDRAEEFVEELVARFDVARLYGALELIADLRAEPLSDRVRDALTRHHGPLGEAVAEVLAFRAYVERLRVMRSQIVDPELRFFLALVVMVPDRSEILSLLGERFPERDPELALVELLTRLLQSEAFSFALEGEDAQWFVACVLAGRTDDEFLTAMKQGIDDAVVDDNRAFLLQLRSEIADIPFIRQLL